MLVETDYLLWEHLQQKRLFTAEQLRQAFAGEGYEVRIENTRVGREVYITKGGLFKAALGLRSALRWYYFLHVTGT